MKRVLAFGAFDPLQKEHMDFLRQAKELGDHLYVVSVDDGTEKRCENFVERAYPELTEAQVYARLAYLDKYRISYDQSVIRFKPFSVINENNFDKEGTYILIDDMFASGGTANQVAELLKSLGAKRVEVWVSHIVTVPEQLELGNDRRFIDKLVGLNTVPALPGLNAEYIKASADLLAAELYKIHQKLIASR